MNTQENNKLIAEFMGYNLNNLTPSFLNNLHYHTSWNWLMPVVEKINLLDDYRYTVYIASMDTRIEDNITGDVVVDINCKHSVDELIRSVYEAVVEFIKQYNKYICGSCGENCNEYTYNEETDVDECNQCKTI